MPGTTPVSAGAALPAGSSISDTSTGTSIVFVFVPIAGAGAAAAAVVLVAAVRCVLFVFLFSDGANKWSFSKGSLEPCFTWAVIPLTRNDSCFMNARNYNAR
jgi:hypothetical protein